MAATVIPAKKEFRRGIQAQDDYERAVHVAISPTFTPAADTHTADTFELFRIHPGIEILDLIFQVTTALTSGQVTAISIGDSDNASRLMTSDAFTLTAGRKAMDGVLGFEYQDSDPRVIQITYTTTSDFAAGEGHAILWYTDKVDS